MTLTYQTVAPRENDLVEFIYPLKTNGKATSTLEKFSVAINLKDKHAISTIYSPTHGIAVTRPTDNTAKIVFERDQALLDKDFQLFYTLSSKGGDIGLTAMMHRPISGEKGYFMLLISPRVEIPKEKQVPRDMVFVLDTSGSMSEDNKLQQAQKALKYCLSNLTSKDRFGLINFATTVDHYTNGLVNANKDQIAQAKKWVDGLEATGGTNIDEALTEALKFRSKDTSRTFTIVFFTDGQPTFGELNPEKILKNFKAKNTDSTRVFTFGVGNDVNATMLDALADQSRGVSTYVRPAEDIEAKVSALYTKISSPVLTNLKLMAGDNIKLAEVYPPHLPDLFHGGQLVVLGRFAGKGHAALTLSGRVGKDKKDFVYEVSFPEKTTNDDKAFVEDIWARRKVGYLLDQIRASGESKELKDEVIKLAKKYGIATPYTSYLVVPDAPVPVVSARGGKPVLTIYSATAPVLEADRNGGRVLKVKDFAKKAQGKDGELAKNRGLYEDEDLKAPAKGDNGKARRAAKEQKDAYDKARDALAKRLQNEVQAGKLGVDLSVQSNNLRYQKRLTQTALRRANGRNCLEIGGVWIDEGYNAKMKIVAVRAQSAAYFRILARHPKLKDVFKLGNHLVWVAPNGTALVIDTTDGKEKLSDKEIDSLFVAKK
jgi:Ca-activated chloride channel family protein